jgi:hypothetical protein
MTKKALLVGINDYAPMGAGGPDLRGCVNDVRDMANTLNALGIVPARPANMRIITDARATRTNIIAGLKWLVSGLKRGDVAVFHYSGHGSQLPDLSGEEADRKDETICPHDYATAGMIKDDDLRAVFSALPAGANLDVILDSCHSGTGTRELEILAEAPALESIAYRYVEPPLDDAFFLDVVDSNPEAKRRGLLKGTATEREAVIVPGLNHVLWGGCRDYQTSAELAIGGVIRGAFTYSFCKCLRGAGPTIPRAKLDAQVSSYIRRMGLSQVPQLEGTRGSIGEKVFT